MMTRWLVLAAAMTACSPTTPNGNPDRGKTDGGDATAASAGTDSCKKISSCLGGCADTDTACQNACMAKGSTGGQQKITALTTCIDQHECMDADCAKMACAAEITACLDDVDAKSDAGAVTMGNIPAELVGDWATTDIHYHFDANGNYFEVGVLASHGTCIAYDHIDFTDTGIASVSGNQLTTSATTSKQDTTDCYGTKTSKTYPGNTDVFTWSIQGTTLTLVGQTGTIEYQKQ